MSGSVARSGPYCWIGSYSSADAPGAITGAVADPRTGALARHGDAVPAHNASYLARAASGIVYAVLENDAGEVCAFAPSSDGSLLPHGSPRSTGGSGPCHLSVHPNQAYVLTTNYGSGSVAVHPMATDGSLSAATDVVQHHGHGPDDGPGGRQTQPHAHMVASRQDSAGRWTILVTDLGTDRVVQYELDLDSGRLQQTDETRLPAGSGPRHLAVGGRYVYVVGELDSTLTVLDLDADDKAARIVATTSTAPGSAGSFPSAVRLSPDGRRCYVANRGPDTIAVLSVDGPRVRLEGSVSTQGEHPRDLALSPDGRMLYVANQASDSVQSFRVDPVTGMPSAVGDPLRTSQPSCIVFDRGLDES